MHVDIAVRLQKPNATFWLGTDPYWRGYDYDPVGNDGAERPELVPRATDGNPATSKIERRTCAAQ